MLYGDTLYGGGVDASSVAPGANRQRFFWAWVHDDDRFAGTAWLGA